MRDAIGDVLPDKGDDNTLYDLVRALAEGAADPAHPHCAAHLHCPPLAVATAADLAAGVLNPSLDSWDQAPAASELEALVTRALAAEAGAADALVTTGGTESNQLALLLAREAHSAGPVRLVSGPTPTTPCPAPPGCSDSPNPSSSPPPPAPSTPPPSTRP